MEKTCNQQDLKPVTGEIGPPGTEVFHSVYYHYLVSIYKLRYFIFSYGTISASSILPWDI